MAENYLSRSIADKQKDSGVPDDIVKGLYAVFPSAIDEGYLPNNFANIENMLTLSDIEGKESKIEQQVFSFAYVLKNVIEKEQTKETAFLQAMINKYGELDKYPFLKQEIKELKELLEIKNSEADLTANFPTIFKKMQSIISKLSEFQEMVKNNNVDFEAFEKEVETITERDIFTAFTEYVHDERILDMSVDDFLDKEFSNYMTNYLAQKGGAIDKIKSFVETIKKVAEIKDYSALQSYKATNSKIKDVKELKSNKGKKRVINNIEDLADALVITLLNGKLRGMAGETTLTISGTSSAGQVEKTLTNFLGGQSQVQGESDNVVILSAELEIVTEDVFDTLRKANNGALTSEKISEYIHDAKNNVGWVIRYSSKDQSGGRYEQYLSEGWDSRKDFLQGGSGAVTAKHSASLNSRINTILDFSKTIGNDKNIDNFLFILANVGKSLLYEKEYNKAKELLLQLSFVFLLEEWGIEERVRENIEQVKNYPEGAKTIHVFYLNGEYYPGSFFLKTILANVEKRLSKGVLKTTLSKELVIKEGGVEKKISALEYYLKMKEQVPPGIARWNNLRAFNLEKTTFDLKIDDTALQDFIQVLSLPEF